MKKYNFLFIIYLYFYSSIFAQTPIITMQNCYGTSDMNLSYAIEQAENGYLVGIEIPNGENVTNYHGLTDIWLLRIDTLGNILWEKCYGGSNYDAPYKIIKTKNEQYYIYGATKSQDGDIQSTHYGGADLWLLKIDSEGDLLWEKCYGGPGIDEVRDMIITPDNGLLLLCRTSSSGGNISQFYGLTDIWMCKCDSLGNIEWEKTLGNQGLDNCVSLLLNSDNNIMMIGAVQQHGGMVECYPDGVWGDVWLVELDLQGNIISQHCYGGSDYDVGFNILELDSGYLLSNYTSSNDGDVSGLHGPPGGPPNGHSDIWIVKINKQFEILWQKCLGGYDTDYPNYISQIEGNKFILFGWTGSNDGDVSGNHSAPGGYDKDIWAVKLDSTGEIEWQQCFGGWGSERLENPHTILKKSDYDFVIASSTDYSPSYDVQCGSIGGSERDAWIFEIKDCSYYAPGIPVAPAGPDTVCTEGGQQDLYSIPPATNAMYYEWVVQPQEAGTIAGDSITGTVQWATDYEGTAAIMVRSVNDCGESLWSQPHFVQVYSCIGVEELERDGIRLKVYPNPAKDYVVFEVQGSKFEVQGSKFGGSGITIMDIYGQKVAELPVRSEKTVWQTEGVEAGLYFYRVETGGKVVLGKLMIIY